MSKEKCNCPYCDSELVITIVDDSPALNKSAKSDKLKQLEKPVEEKPIEEKPIEEKPIEEKPIEEKTSFMDKLKKCIADD